MTNLLQKVLAGMLSLGMLLSQTPVQTGFAQTATGMEAVHIADATAPAPESSTTCMTTTAATTVTTASTPKSTSKVTTTGSVKTTTAATTATAASTPKSTSKVTTTGSVKTTTAATTVTTASTPKSTSKVTTTGSVKTTTAATATTTASTPKSTSKITTTGSVETTTTTTASTPKSTSKVTTTGSVKTTTAATTTTTGSVETTTEPIEQPKLYLEVDPGCPAGQTLLHLYLLDNPGLSALGLRITLPDVLTPVLAEDHFVEITPTAALNGTSVALYNPERSYLTFAYSSTKASAAEPELGTFLLNISPEAVCGTEYAVTLALDSIYSPNLDLTGCVCVDTAHFSAVAPTERTLSETAVVLNTVGATHALTLSPAPKAGACVWHSSDETVATVDANGVITAVESGEAWITVTCETLTYRCKVTVEIPRALTEQELTFEKLGAQQALALTPAPQHAEIVWASDAPEVATVDENGVVTAVSVGTAHITAICEHKTYLCTVTIALPRGLNETRLVFTDLKQSKQLEMYDTEGLQVTWGSSAPEVVDVDDTGLVTPKGLGTAVITAVCEGKLYQCEVSVRMPRELNFTDCTLAGFEHTVQLTLTPAPDAETPVVWQSADALIASVDANGIVTAHNNGNTVITCVCEDITYECILRVKFSRALSASRVVLDAIGAQTQLTLDPAPTNGTPVWKSADETIATVDENGVVTAVSMGQTTLTAVYEGTSYECAVVIGATLRGDTDFSGAVTADDAVLALSAYVRIHVMGMESPLTAPELAAADVNGDGSVTEADAILILRYYTMTLIHDVVDWDALL